MSCIVLIGGGIGCGKTTLINYLLKNKTELFGSDINNTNTRERIDEAESNEKNGLHTKFFVIQFDTLLSIQEQEQMMKTLRGLRNFRVDLLMAAERFIALVCKSENSIDGPLTERSNKLLEKLNSINSFNGDCSSNVVFFVEDNFYYRSMRYEWFQIARRTNLGFSTIFLHCPLNTAVHRNSIRGYQIPECRIKKMLSFMEVPDPTKFKWEKYSLLFDSSPELTNFILTDIINMIYEALKNPAELVISEEKIEAQKICSKNAIHQADKILRRIVSKYISNLKAACADDDGLKTSISDLVGIRQKLLCDIKQGVVHLPQDLIEKIQNLGIESVLDAYEETLTQLFLSTLKEKLLDLSIPLSSLKIEG